MKYGFIVPTGTTHEVIDLAVEVEAAGWDGFFYYDGIGTGSWDPWTILAAAAMKTERVTLGAMLFPLPRRRPWKVAHEVTTVDNLSNGRLVLPVGLGALDAGFSKFHPETYDRKERAEKLDETLAILDLAATGEPFSFQGTHYQIDEVAIGPGTVQRPRVPVWVAGAWGRPKSMRRVLNYDGFLPNFTDGPEHVINAEEIREIRDWLIANRADGTTGEIIAEGVNPDDDSEWFERELKPLAEAGATWWIYSPWSVANDVETLRKRIRQGPPMI